MFCSKCGNEVADGTAFCPKCGTKVGVGEATQTATPVHTESDTEANSTATTKPKRKGRIKIVLEKAGAPTVSVECPAKIKQNPALVLLTMRTSGFPPLNVTPKDGKGFGLHLAAFASIFVLAATAQFIGVVGIILALADLVFNCFLEANYYFKFIKKKISEGYSVKDAEQRTLCEMAGIFGKK